MKKTTAEIRAALPQFIGTENWHRHPFGLLYTDGVQFLAEAAGAYWLIDLIASYQKDPRITKDEMLQGFQLWELVVKEDKSSRATCLRDTNDEAFHQDIEFTDFPIELSPMKLYVSGGVLLLTTEY